MNKIDRKREIMTETKLFIIRHGETQWNAIGRWQGHCDSPLTEKGIRQAKAVANFLTQYQIYAIYSSDLGRAVQTAEIIGARTGQKVILDYRLRERHLGIFQGLTEAEMREKLPDEYNQYKGLN